MAYSQDDTPIDPPFETVSLIDNQTTVVPWKGGFTFEIQHRFSEIKELADLFGIYGSANTRLANAPKIKPAARWKAPDRRTCKESLGRGPL